MRIGFLRIYGTVGSNIQFVNSESAERWGSPTMFEQGNSTQLQHSRQAMWLFKSHPMKPRRLMVVAAVRSRVNDGIRWTKDTAYNSVAKFLGGERFGGTYNYWTNG